MNWKKELKFFKKQSYKDKLEMSYYYLSSFLNSNNNLSNFPNNQVIKAATLVLELHIKNQVESEISYNRVLCRLLNNDEDYSKINKLFHKNIKVLQNKDTLYFDNGHIIGNNLENLIEGRLNRADEFAYIIKDGYFCVIVDEKTNLPKIDGFNIFNAYNRKSIAIPLNKIKNLNNKLLNGKDWIKHYIFHPEENVEGSLYFLKMKHKNLIFYKVGITKHNVDKRFTGLKDVDILEKFEVRMNMLEASIIERYIHNINFKYRTHLENKTFAGQNECYYNDLRCLYNEDILNKAISYLDVEGYPISSKIMKQIIEENK